MRAKWKLMPCPICGEPFRKRGGVKDAKTCGRPECTRALMRRSARSKGNEATLQAARGRAQRLLAAARCARCGSTRHVDVHHRDRNVFNNDPANLEPLCRKCHAAEHRRPWRLSADQVAALLADYRSGGVRQVELAGKYGISQSRVSQIIRRARAAKAAP